MASDVTVRDVEKDDYLQWLPLWEAYNVFYGRTGPTALPAAIIDMTWRRFFDAAEPVHALVAQEGRSLVGIAHYLFHRSTTALEPVCYLQDLFTAPERRGGGVGRALIEAVFSRARAAGARKVYWQTHETNLVAQRLYERIAQRSGFIVYRHDLQDEG